MQPSYKHSTLSLAFIGCLSSVFLLIIIGLTVAIVAPAAYELSSSDKMLVLVVLVAYLGFVSNIVGAYLGTRNPSKIPDDQMGVIANQVKTIENEAREDVLDTIDNLALNKLQAHDTSNQ